MFRKIVEELSVVGRGVETERLRMLAPVYLFAAGEWDGDFEPASSLDNLLDDLEKARLFSAQSDGCLTLWLEYGSREWDYEGRLGLVDEAGQFKTTLGQWMDYIMARYQVSQGVVLIHLDSLRQRRAETVWWRRFFRQLHRYRKQFLFLFQAGEAEADFAWEWLGRECFCRKVEPVRRKTQEYIQSFEAGLEKYGLQLGEKERVLLGELLDRYRDRLTCHGLEKWQQALLWEYFLETQSGGQSRGGGTLPAEYLSEEKFCRYIGSEKDKQGIGFEVTKDAAKK